MASGLHDVKNTEPSEMFAAAQEMIQGCAMHLQTCKDITSAMAASTSSSYPEVSERFQAISMRLATKVHTG